MGIEDKFLRTLNIILTPWNRKGESKEKIKQGAAGVISRRPCVRENRSCMVEKLNDQFGPESS